MAEELDPGTSAANPSEILAAYARALRGESPMTYDIIRGVSPILANPALVRRLMSSLSPEDQDALLRGVDNLAEYLAGPEQEPGDLAADAFGEIRRGLSGSSATSTTRDITSKETTAIDRKERRYIDVPTPEEFLDDFRNGLSTHLKNITGMGGVSRLALGWVLDNMDMFLNDYLGTLGQMAARGEDIYNVVGATGEPQFLGERPGEVMSQTSKTEKEEQVSQMAKTLGDAGFSQEEVDNITSRLHSTEDFALKTTEEVFRRPKLSYVAKLSPLQHLEQKFPAKSIMIMYEGLRGARSRQGHAGEGTISTRRVV